MKMRVSKQFAQCTLKQNNLFTMPAIKGLPNRELFARSAKLREMPTDWTIINDVFSAVDDRAVESSDASDILQSEHGSQMVRTRNQHRMSSREQSFDGILPQMTSTPIRPLSRQSSRSTNTRSTSRASLVNPSDLFTPPAQFNNSVPINSNVLAPPSPFKSPIAPPNLGGPIDCNDDLMDFNPNNNNNTESRCVANGSSHQRANGQNTTNVNDEIDESEGDPVDHTDLMATLGKDSSEYLIVTKLIRLWQKQIHPIKVDHLLQRGCNRFQAAKTFAALLSK